MSYTDKNRIFFGLFHYILSEQSNVNWALKTSLVNFTGLNETINQRQYKNDSISNDIIKYIKDVKPYHVQLDNYIEKYSSKDDVCNIIPSDSIFQTIKVRYDAVSIKPDIKDTIYTYTLSGEPIIPNSLSSEVVKYLDIELKSIYIRKFNYKNEPYWELYSSAEEGDIFFIEKEDLIKKFSYISNKDGFGYYDLIELTNKELVDFENTTAANRLFLYKTHDFDLIRDYLNAHYKGLTISGGDFNIDRFGYDAFLYDLKRYEEPAKTCAYCLIDKKYTQISVGDNTFQINVEGEISKNNLKVFSQIGNSERSEILDYFLDTELKQITLFYQTRLNEKIEIKYNNSETFYYTTNTFCESDDESYIKKFVDKDETESNNYKFKIPFSSIKPGKIVVEIEKPNGYRYVTTNFQEDDNNIIISKEEFHEGLNWKCIISIVDYSLIYDKIYSWEDIYGIANNKTAWENYFKNADLIQNNYGGEFLDPYYEKDRPSELSVIYPQNSLTIYTSRANAKLNTEGKISFPAKKLFYFDYKNKQLNYNVIKTTKLKNSFNLGDSEILIEKDIFEKPYVSEYDDKLIPGKIFINSELIEFFDYELHDDDSITLKKLRRGCNGTYINNNSYEVGTIVYPSYNETSLEYDITPSYYYIKSNDMKSFIINGDSPLEHLVKVYKTTNIILLSDINKDSKSFNISSNTINLPEYDENNNLTKKGFLFIGDDKIEFKTIENKNGYYEISNFNLPLNKSYKSGEMIASIKYNEVNPSEYEIKEESYDELRHLNGDKMKKYIVFNSALNKGECLIIENHNKNVFN